jgi:hypothetical protein
MWFVIAFLIGWFVVGCVVAFGTGRWLRYLKQTEE